MKKFESNNWDLDICDRSQPSLFDFEFSNFNHQSYSILVPTRLNNQIIIIMSDLGVPNSTFLDLQEKWFADEKQPPRRTQ
jgi:hypothetical protein